MLLEDTDALYEKIKSLNELLWEHRVTRPAVDRWLGNFTGECKDKQDEHNHALYLLSKFMYFGHVQVRELLRAMFQDIVRHRLSVEVRASLPDKNNFDKIHERVSAELDGTRFLALGNPSESATHILYDFRVANGMSTYHFANLDELSTAPVGDPVAQWACDEVHRLVFLDDFCGTGNQASDMASEQLPDIRRIAKLSNVQVEIWYLALLATTTGLEKLRSQGLFERVDCVSELDESYRVFGDKSQIYVNAPEGIGKGDAEEIARHYGNSLFPGNPLGYADSQLLLGFQHNVPDNTLPIIWQERKVPPWHAIFPRAPKY